MTTHDEDCIIRYPDCPCLTCVNDSKSLENACCIKHARHCYNTANCEDYVFETQDESFKIPKIKKLAKEKEIQEESEVKQISFESLMKGDATAWNASKQQ